MKKILTFVFGLMFFAAAQAQVCNQNTQDCSELWVGSIKRYEGFLRTNPVFMKDGVPYYTQEFQKYTESWNNCSTWLCRNRATQGWHDKVMKIMMDFDSKLKQQGKVNAVAPTDKWSDQCVVAKNPKVSAYTDMSGNSKAGEVSEYIGYKVTKTSNEYVGLTNSQNGRFSGWAKKAELEMQDMRNCNM